MKKSMIMFMICIALIGIGILFGTQIINTGSKKAKKMNETKENTKYHQLDNINEKIAYYKEENTERYIIYKDNHPNISTEQVIIDVNIGLDYPYYTNEKPAQLPNSSMILVNKYNYLTEEYIPENLEEINEKYAVSNMKLVSYAKNAFEELAESAKNENLNIIAMSTYRSYQYQRSLYNRYVSQDGQEAADTYSARPGYSEHQTGLAVDVYDGKNMFDNFKETKEFTWLKENAHKFGFIMRYSLEKERETGYKYEPWHYRYVGKEIAEYIYKNNISYEEYYIKFIENKKN